MMKVGNQSGVWMWYGMKRRDVTLTLGTMPPWLLASM